MVVLPLFSRDLAAGEAWKLEFGPTVRRVSGEVRQEFLRSARVPALSWPEGGTLSLPNGVDVIQRTIFVSRCSSESTLSSSHPTIVTSVCSAAGGRKKDLSIGPYHEEVGRLTDSPQ